MIAFLTCYLLNIRSNKSLIYGISIVNSGPLVKKKWPKTSRQHGTLPNFKRFS